jgi:hypothetical protein
MIALCRGGPSSAGVEVLEEEPANSDALNLRDARERFSVLTMIWDRGLSKRSMVRGLRRYWKRPQRGYAALGRAVGVVAFRQSKRTTENITPRHCHLFLRQALLFAELSIAPSVVHRAVLAEF